MADDRKKAAKLDKAKASMKKRCARLVDILDEEIHKLKAADDISGGTQSCKVHVVARRRQVHQQFSPTYSSYSNSQATCDFTFRFLCKCLSLLVIVIVLVLLILSTYPQWQRLLDSAFVDSRARRHYYVIVWKIKSNKNHSIRIFIGK